MHAAVRPNGALRPGGRRIVDDAASIDRKVDHAVPCLEEDLRLRSRHRLIGDEVTDRLSTVGRRIVVDNGKDPEVRKLAEEIIKAQEAEIAIMEAWLQKNGAAAAEGASNTDHGAH